MITELTREQEDLLLCIRQEWEMLGQCCESANRWAAETAMIGFYKKIKKPPPAFLWVDSPLTGALVTIIMNSRSSLWSSLDSSLGSSLWSSLGSSLRSSLWSSLDSSLRSSLDSSLDSSLGSSLRSSLRSSPSNCWHWGTHDGAWIAFYDFCRRIGVKYEKENNAALSLHVQYARSALWASSYEKVSFLCERPTKVHMIRHHHGYLILHCDGGPAVAFRDGFAVWALNGVMVSKKIAETPAEKLDPLIFAKERNVEIRKEILRKIGVDRLQQKLGSKLLDSGVLTFPDVNDDPMPREAAYELHLINLSGSTGEWPYLRMWNPSEHCWHLEAVPRECRTVGEALKFRNGGEFVHLAPLS